MPNTHHLPKPLRADAAQPPDNPPSHASRRRDSETLSTQRHAMVTPADHDPRSTLRGWTNESVDGPPLIRDSYRGPLALRSPRAGLSERPRTEDKGQPKGWSKRSNDLDERLQDGRRVVGKESTEAQEIPRSGGRSNEASRRRTSPIRGQRRSVESARDHHEKSTDNQCQWTKPLLTHEGKSSNYTTELTTSSRTRPTCGGTRDRFHDERT